LNLHEAAECLSDAVSERVSDADLLRLVIEGHLNLSVHLPTKVSVTCKRIDSEAGNSDQIRKQIEGLWDVPMAGRARLQMEHDYQMCLNGRYVPIDGPVGALVEGEGLVCQVPPDRGETGLSPRPQSEFPRGSVLAIRTAELDSFLSRHASEFRDRANNASDKPVGRRERDTLLTIIAALAKPAGINVRTPSKAGGTIEAMTIEIGARVSGRTIEEHLKRIPDALERRKI
jgi:hypothetical protein